MHCTEQRVDSANAHSSSATTIPIETTIPGVMSIPGIHKMYLQKSTSWLQWLVGVVQATSMVFPLLGEKLSLCFLCYVMLCYVRLICRRHPWYFPWQKKTFFCLLCLVSCAVEATIEVSYVYHGIIHVSSKYLVITS